MKANVQISAVKKEFKNGQQGWQVFVDGMEGRLRCKMNFTNALKAIRYSFLLSKRLNLQINDIQLAALSLEYQQSKSAAEQAKVAEDATQAAQEAAAKAGEAEEHGEASNEELEAARQAMSSMRMYKFREQYPDAVVIERKKLNCVTFGESAEACAAALDNTPEHLFDGTLHFLFDIEMLDKCIQKLIANGKRVALWDTELDSENLPEFQARVDELIAQNKKAKSPLFKQFCDLKKKHPDALLLFRSGDVYMCYEEDAIKAAEILVLTDISSTDDNITVACFPHHALDTYLPKLIRAGIRVAICDQLEAPNPKKQAQMELFTNA